MKFNSLVTHRQIGTKLRWSPRTTSKYCLQEFSEVKVASTDFLTLCPSFNIFVLNIEQWATSIYYLNLSRHACGNMLDFLSDLTLTWDTPSNYDSVMYLHCIVPRRTGVISSSWLSHSCKVTNPICAMWLPWTGRGVHLQVWNVHHLYIVTEIGRLLNWSDQTWSTQVSSGHELESVLTEIEYWVGLKCLGVMQQIR